MKNTVLKNIYTESDDYKYVDYFELKYNKIKDTIPDKYLEYYTLVDNSKLEKVSFDLYGTTVYWDLISAINNMDPLFDMPYDFDVVSDLSQEIVDNYLLWTFKGTISDEHREMLYENIRSKEESRKETFRSIKVVKPIHLQTVIKLLRTEGLI